jgi:Flp pilus assembly protein CpaB
VKLSQRRLARPSLGGLLATRQGSLLLALLCAVLAAGILVFALGRYKTGLRTPVTQASVLVATSEIPKGTSGQTVASERLYKLQPVAASQVTPGALSDAAVIASEVAAVDLLPGQQLTAADFAPVGDVAETLAPDQRAVSLSIGEAQGDTDVVQAGDHVDIYQQIDLPHLVNAPIALSSASSASSTSSTSQTQLFLPIFTNVLVIKPATATPVKRDGVPVVGGAMVLGVAADQVAPLMSAITRGPLYLSLRPPTATATPGQSFAAELTQISSKFLNALAPNPSPATSPQNP